MSLFSCLSKSVKVSQYLKIRLILLSLSSFFVVSSAQATTVQFQTLMGDIEVNLFDKTTPETVKNFLTYVENGDYNNSVIHRSVTYLNTDGSKKPFVIQGGGYTYKDKFPLVAVKSRGYIINEPVYSNIRGTIAMAKLTGQPNSASKEWYFNLHNDNAASLDPNISKSGGYTVFGQVTEASLPVLDAIVALNTFNIGGGLSEFPIQNYTIEDYVANVLVERSDLVLITNVVVLNASPDTADSLNPTKNTLLVIEEDKKGGGGGSLNLWQLVLLVLLSLGSGKALFNKQK